MPFCFCLKIRRSEKVIDFQKIETNNPVGVSCLFEIDHVIPTGFGYLCLIFYNPFIPSGLQTIR